MKALADKKRARTIARQLRRNEGALTQKAFTIGL
jgi:hypothetical protein